MKKFYILIMLLAYCLQQVSAQNANRSLSNLTSPVALNVDLLPKTDDSLNLGSAAKSWKDIYADGSLYLGGARFLAYKAGTGLSNTAVGAAALNGNTTGVSNTALGSNALFSNISGGFNTAGGYQSLYSNTTGSFNTANGTYALHSNNSGGLNTANGYQALYLNKSGNSNTANGYTAMRSNTSGNYNTANGYGALYSNTTGSYNVANGYFTLYNNKTGNANVAIGRSALYYNISGGNLVAVGDSALYHDLGGSEGGFDGDNNTAIGSKAMFNNSSGFQNTAIGTLALSQGDGLISYDYWPAMNCTAIGYQALYNNSSAANVAVGSQALYSDSLGSGNVAIGVQALYKNHGGYIGSIGGISCYGCENTAIGYDAGSNLLEGYHNTFIGNESNCGALGEVINSTVIGNGAVITASNHFLFGGTDVVGWGFGVESGSKAIKVGTSSANGNGAYLTAGGVWTNTSARSKKEDFQKQIDSIILNKINKLDVTKWKYKGTDSEYHYGPMADDFHRLFAVGDDSSISDMDKTGILFLGMQALTAENQKLKTKNSDLVEQVNAQQKEIDQLKEMMVLLQQKFNGCNPCNAAATSNAIQQNNITLNNAASLEQNIPNPFTNTTTIGYYLPGKLSSGKIIVTDKTGKQLKQINIGSSGKGTITVDASTLTSGAYNYSLYVDGKVIASKQMVLVK